MPSVATRLQDFTVITVGALIFLALSWSWARMVRRGRSLTPRMRKMLTFGSLFVFGSAYIMMFGSWSAWPQKLWFVLIAAWGAALALVAWWRHGHKPPGPRGPSVPTA